MRGVCCDNLPHEVDFVRSSSFLIIDQISNGGRSASNFPTLAFESCLLTRTCGRTMAVWACIAEAAAAAAVGRA